MKNLHKLGVIVAALASFGMANAELGVGNPAPALKVAKWAKGKPVAKFEPGKVYVVEFWATWCGPCKQSIPHLTELAKKFKDKVTFTGVSVWENQDNSKSNAYVAKVEKFVKDMGTRWTITSPLTTLMARWLERGCRLPIRTEYLLRSLSTKRARLPG